MTLDPTRLQASLEPPPMKVDCECEICGLEIYEGEERFECECGKIVHDESTCRGTCYICHTKACLGCLKKDPDIGEYFCKDNSDCEEAMDKLAEKR